MQSAGTEVIEHRREYNWLPEPSESLQQARTQSEYAWQQSLYKTNKIICEEGAQTQLALSKASLYRLHRQICQGRYWYCTTWFADAQTSSLPCTFAKLCSSKRRVTMQIASHKARRHCNSHSEVAQCLELSACKDLEIVQSFETRLCIIRTDHTSFWHA